MLLISISCAGCSTLTLKTSENTIPKRFLVCNYPDRNAGIPLDAYKAAEAGNLNFIVYEFKRIVREKNRKLTKCANNAQAAREYQEDLTNQD